MAANDIDAGADAPSAEFKPDRFWRTQFVLDKPRVTAREHRAYRRMHGWLRRLDRKWERRSQWEKARAQEMIERIFGRRG